jgi:GntR family transcriptional regulator/MocR family aminotransferase
MKPPIKISHVNNRRRRSIITFEMIRLDRSAIEPLHEQLYRKIRDELESGSFGNNANRLPSSRSLATDLRVSRPTVTRAFAKLHAEGFLRSKTGSGTFVANPLPEAFLRVRRPPTAKQEVARRPRISERAAKIPDKRTARQFDIGCGDDPGAIFVPGPACVRSLSRSL